MSLAEQWYAQQMQRHQEFRQRQQSVASFLEETRSHQQRVWLEERQKRAAFMAALRHSVWGKTPSPQNGDKDETGSGQTNKPQEVKWETLWQIGTPGVQEFPQTGGGIQIFNYDVERDPNSTARPQMPGWIGVPAILPYVRPLTTAQ
ncbi:hypothetical protein H6S82_10785, partial [Planktothrix sp. FACHB-1355]|nr:hypothetical protein [Planktothrix sp. FACHB-1355]